MTQPDRPSRGIEGVVSNTPKGVIRGLAIALACLGFGIIAAIAIRNAIWQVPISLGSMVWGVVLFGLGCLIIQKGDVSTSIKEAADAVINVRRGVFTFWGGKPDAPDPAAPPPAPFDFKGPLTDDEKEKP